MEASRGPPRVKNKAPAPQQISAEQLLREAVDRQEPALQAPTQRFADLEELHEYQGRKRKEFEDYVRRNRISMNNWMRYAQWELEQKEFRRARSVFERALDVDPTAVVLWIRYIEAEMKTRNINHARNLLDRAVTILPRVDKLWYKYVYMEEMLGNIAGTRQVFERWMSWEPDEGAWGAYIKLEKRYNEFDRVRAIFERFTVVHPEPKNWIKWARFEEEYGTSDLVREVYGLAIETLGEDFMDEKLFIAYARYEAKLKEFERARAIYKYALDRLPRSKSMALHKAYTTFEKQFGDRDGVEDVILAKRRVQYEEQIKENPKNYDIWFDFVRLEETSGDVDRVRDVYERAIAQIPPSQEKRHWRRYIYLWIFYALWEELETKDMERARQIYQECIKLIPHKKFTFAKIWLMKAQFEIRQMDLQAARKTLGHAIGACPKDKLFKGYIDLERQLFEFVRCRKLFEKQIEWNPANCQAWIKFAELERGLDDIDRARAIYELGISQPVLDMPELLWKSYIDFEEYEGEYDRTRMLYERLLEKTDHVKVWINYARFEINIPEGEEEEEEEEEEKPVSEEAKRRARKVFERAHNVFKEKEMKEERVALLNAWKSFEQTHGSPDDITKIERQMPSKVKKRRKLDDDRYEEYMDYMFPADDESSAKLSQILQRAHQWKKQQASSMGKGEA
ncbi:NineTeen Complex (NTC) component [Blastomyces dermatitidis]|uniref:Pre-mRNA-splicing factor CLF1 n=3 Tax=Blastomyces TaxID=229219 RepID=A0A179UQL2_BLAGS|nr:pre-mRNA-splicing factor CLF1 [Blastomyces gilchristii SLH14081]XP_045277124.1 pre-mRNA-splicing factor CLF1 [Blastomyces dermatitidis ER-3]EGE80752.1 pre-mRNA-splicing factor CLF1 [Blastomyces dermatitidis ATCC 18188]EQL30468.1 pre-mRNA-splicing factor CLF1 [Blastomyces dermatitidis ATCC 26199]EEQ90380.1 pre-mRNA-splicing factor CLF1 [Blastomyces dermatitidis ER-3]OAT10304.1 pre-mRNA-splicing factor CLF1 [Blastomyces gilchristii SLH14081]